MTTNRTSVSEEVYVARQEAERRRVFALDAQRQMEQAERERLKALHYLRCPKCGMALETVTLQGVQIDRCYSCNGSWLDEGELSRSLARNPVSCRRSSASSGAQGRNLILARRFATDLYGH